MSGKLRLLTAAIAVLALASVAQASGPFSKSHTTHCHWLFCPPGLKHCQEGPPHIHIKCACPRPICSPCEQPNFGYYQSCWTPWPFPPDWSHCPMPVPAATVAPAPLAPAPSLLPPPRTMSMRPGL